MQHIHFLIFLVSHSATDQNTNNAAGILMQIYKVKVSN